MIQNLQRLALCCLQLSSLLLVIVHARASMFIVVAFALLGIERFLYGYIYHFPESFKSLCKGPLRSLLSFTDDGLFWLAAKHLGIVIKVFQYGVIGYDLLFRR